MIRYSIYRNTSDRELLYLTDVSGPTPVEAIKRVIREWPGHLKPYAAHIVAVPHSQVEGCLPGAIFTLPRTQVEIVQRSNW